MADTGFTGAAGKARLKKLKAGAKKATKGVKIAFKIGKGGIQAKGRQPKEQTKLQRRGKTVKVGKGFGGGQTLSRGMKRAIKNSKKTKG